MVTETEGLIKSPSYPDDYPNNAFYGWILPAESGKSVRLVFVEFDIEDGYEREVSREVQTNCYTDYVEIYSGTGIDHQSLLGRYMKREFTDMMISSNDHQ